MGVYHPCILRWETEAGESPMCLNASCKAQQRRQRIPASIKVGGRIEFSELASDRLTHMLCHKCFHRHITHTEVCQMTFIAAFVRVKVVIVQVSDEKPRAKMSFSC